MLKAFIRKAVRAFGYEIQPAVPSESRWDAEYLGQLTPPIATCIDVGVGTGTQSLYRSFPDAFLVLVEPLSEYEDGLKKILSTRNGAYFLTAVGANEETRAIVVEPDAMLRSSFLERTALTRSGGTIEQRSVAVTTLDNLLEKKAFEAPFGLKIDTEGFELEVLKGSTRSLQSCAFVIAEVSYAERFEGGYSFSDLTEFMSQHGFYLHEILQVAGTPVLYFDALFLRVASAD